MSGCPTSSPSLQAVVPCPAGWDRRWPDLEAVAEAIAVAVRSRRIAADLDLVPIQQAVAVTVRDVIVAIGAVRQPVVVGIVEHREADVAPALGIPAPLRGQVPEAIQRFRQHGKHRRSDIVDIAAGVRGSSSHDAEIQPQHFCSAPRPRSGTPVGLRMPVLSAGSRVLFAVWGPRR
jgi:hypothetical protein